MSTTQDSRVQTIGDMTNGEYTVLSYEKKRSKYGTTYILKCSLGNQVYSIWGNGYIGNYIYDEAPTKKFKIVITDGRVTIPVYSRIVVLK